MGHHLIEQGALVGRNIISRRTFVGRDHRGAGRGLRQLELRALLVQQEAFALHSLACLVADAHRNLPRLRRGAFRTYRQIAFLPQGHGRRTIAFQRDGNFRNAGLIEKGLKRRAQPRLGGTDGVQKIAHAGVFVGVTLQIGIDSALKLLFAGPDLEHADDRRAFLIRDVVKGIRNIVVGEDLLADFARRDQAVLPHRSEFRAQIGDTGIPFRLPLGQNLRRGPGGEGFVEPGVVPPGEGDQIAEPLVGKFMRADARVFAPALLGIGRRVGEQDVLRVGDQAGIFHRSETKGQRDGDGVGFFVRIGDSEVALQPLDNGGGDVRRVLRLVGLTLRREDAHGRSVPADPARVHHVERADGEGHQIAGQRLA